MSSTAAASQHTQSEFASVVLENDALRVVVLPGLGGKIGSIVSRRSGAELLLQPLRPYARATRDSAFDQSDKSGFDECLPSVSACPPSTPGGPVPDHGDVWRLPWRCEREGDHAVHMAVDAFSRPLRFTRRLELQGASLKLDYTVHNLSEESVEFLWSAHPAFAVEAGDRIALPAEVERVTVQSSLGQRLGPARNECTWPIAHTSAGEQDLSIVCSTDAGTADKLFTRALTQGWCGLYRARLGQGLCVRFSPAQIPYLGLWLCYAGWPKQGSEKQYTVAMEPTTSAFDSLQAASVAHMAPRLGAGESMRWQVQLELIGSSEGVDWKGFREACERELNDHR